MQPRLILQRIWPALLLGVSVLITAARLEEAAETGNSPGPQVLFRFSGEKEGDAAGREVAGIGDIDKDGVPDIAVGAPGTRNLSGTAFIYSGATGKLIHRFEGKSSGIVFGRSLDGLGDLDGDGASDFVVGSPQADLMIGEVDSPDAGEVTVYSGRQGRPLYTYRGQIGGDYLGTSVSAAGDLDQDGVPDFVYTAPNSGGFAGTLFAHSGKDGELLYQVNGDKPGSRYGWALDGGGDIDGDQIPDIVVGAPWTSSQNMVNNGAVFVYSGKDGRLILRQNGPETGDGYGRSVAILGDLDKDGHAEFAVGAPLANPGKIQDAGSVFVYSGKTHILKYRFDGEAQTDIFGFSVARAGDVNGDGVADIIAGGQWSDPNGSLNAGSAYVYSGASGKLLYRFNGTDASQEYGFAVASLGDLNRDGLDEVVIGAPGDHHSAGAAAVVAWSKSGK